MMLKFKVGDRVFSTERGEGFIDAIGGSIMGVMFHDRYIVHLLNGVDRAHPDDPEYRIHHKLPEGCWRDGFGVVHDDA